ncbi:ABC transporter ATP-binding protein [Streptomyces boluensis]|uniref:ABC-type xenobiotic transporter n=1 Tax=Streptomyces boluensis TaxID=1775135 RepID=A0A964XJT7_9ACTN|nr:ATP-binding cassette domain-containing protein [Streptomyces boluensis]NBE51505.1 ATP-binding cassette domain-containing protein [Streptomyces boluensis]
MSEQRTERSEPTGAGRPAAPNAPAAPAVRATGLRKAYGEVEVLKGLDLTVPRGTVYALLGPNGAGKTTTVRILATLTEADAGSATVAGHDVRAERSRVRRAISLTGQFAAVDEMQTGAENLRMMARLAAHATRRATAPTARRTSEPATEPATGRASARAAARAAELLDRFDLTDAADRLVKTYSGGMRRRLDLAASLVGNPEVIFLDEPTTGLDPRSRQEMWRVVRELAAQGTTVFLTTQYLEEADQLADRIAVLHQGTLVAEGTADELKRRVAGHRLDLVVTAAAYHRLAPRAAHHAPETRTLGFPTDGRAREVRELLDALDPDRTGVESFALRTATLDDVFLTLTNPTSPVSPASPASPTSPTALDALAAPATTEEPSRV